MALTPQTAKKKKPKKAKKERSYKGKALIWIFVLMIVDEVTPGVPLAEAFLIALLIFPPRWLLDMVHKIYDYVPHRQAWRTVGDICQRQVVTASPDTPVIDIARMMRDEHVRSLVVVEKRKALPADPQQAMATEGEAKVDKRKKKKKRGAADDSSTLLIPVGILTDRDMALKVEAQELPWQTTTVGEVMTTRLEMVEDSESVHSAVEKMTRCGVRQLPVVDKRGALLGTLSLDDTIAMLSDSLDDMVELLQREIQRESKIKG